MPKEKCRLVVLSLIRARLSAGLPVFCNYACIQNARVLTARVNPAGYFEPIEVQIVGRSAWIATRDIFYYFNDSTLAAARSRARAVQGSRLKGGAA
jgi:hypothetical protein